AAPRASSTGAGQARRLLRHRPAASCTSARKPRPPRRDFFSIQQGHARAPRPGTMLRRRPDPGRPASRRVGQCHAPAAERGRGGAGGLGQGRRRRRPGRARGAGPLRRRAAALRRDRPGAVGCGRGSDGLRRALPALGQAGPGLRRRAGRRRGNDDAAAL
ncbi:MAG: hypothetical protein AVDCRST_MAG04-2304, partial [uncultured Acetobacteraceae bacterium]